MNTEYDLAYWKACACCLEYRLNRSKLRIKNANRRLKDFKKRLKSSKSDRVKACVRKEIYRTEAEAQCVCQIQGYGTRAYKCIYCNGWHISTKKVTT